MTSGARPLRKSFCNSLELMDASMASDPVENEKKQNLDARRLADSGESAKSPRDQITPSPQLRSRSRARSSRHMNCPHARGSYRLLDCCVLAQTQEKYVKLPVPTQVPEAAFAAITRARSLDLLVFASAI